MPAPRLRLAGSYIGGNTVESLFYDLISEAASGGKRFSIVAMEIDDESVDASTTAAVHQRLTTLGIDPRACEFEFSTVTFSDPQDGDPGHVIYFIGVELHTWLAGYVVHKGAILAKLESTSSA